MRRMWVYTFVCTAAMALGALFFGVAASAATDTGATLHTRLAALDTRQSPAAVEQQGEVTTAALTATPEKKAAPIPGDAAAPGTAAGRRTGGSRGGGSELSQARAILAGLIAQHPILRGTTVTFGNTQGYQAISYYKTGQIILSTSHAASLERILNHEVWHIIDWRDNHRIDWGENIPPR